MFGPGPVHEGLEANHQGLSVHNGISVQNHHTENDAHETQAALM